VSRIRVGGAELELLPGKAAWWAAERTLLVADAHIGKAVSYRRLGVPVPEATTGGNLEALDALLAAHDARRIVFLGDLLHSERSHARETLDAFSYWRELRTELSLVLVRGNHDDRAGDPPPAWGIECVDEPFALPAAPGLALCHHPEPRAGRYVLAGHNHPCITVGRGIDRLRLPCFHFGAEIGVLPAFGAFTGMHPIERAPGDRVFVVADDRVVEIGIGAPRPRC
jgi:DNA ligase-associated metallophosphoesterase